MRELSDFVNGKAGDVGNVRNGHVFLRHIPGNGNRFCLLTFFSCAVESGEFIVAGFLLRIHEASWRVHPWKV